MTELGIKCAKKDDKADVHYLSSSDMKYESNPVDDDMAYWQDEYEQFMCGLDFKIMND